MTEPMLPCEMDPERWFADFTTEESKQRVLSAMKACKACPALEPCKVETAKVKPKFGVWAGRFYTEPRRSHRSRMAEMEMENG